MPGCRFPIRWGDQSLVIFESDLERCQGALVGGALVVLAVGGGDDRDSRRGGGLICRNAYSLEEDPDPTRTRTARSVAAVDFVGRRRRRHCRFPSRHRWRGDHRVRPDPGWCWRFSRRRVGSNWPSRGSIRSPPASGPRWPVCPASWGWRSNRGPGHHDRAPQPCGDRRAGSGRGRGPATGMRSGRGCRPVQEEPAHGVRLVFVELEGSKVELLEPARGRFAGGRVSRTQSRWWHPSCLL